MQEKIAPASRKILSKVLDFLLKVNVHRVIIKSQNGLDLL